MLKDLSKIQPFWIGSPFQDKNSKIVFPIKSAIFMIIMNPIYIFKSTSSIFDRKLKGTLNELELPAPSFEGATLFLLFPRDAPPAAFPGLNAQTPFRGIINLYNKLIINVMQS